RRNTDEIAVMDDGHFRHCFRVRCIDGGQLRSERRRSKHFSMEHGRKLDVRTVFVLASDERAAIDFGGGVARDLPLSGGSCRRVFGYGFGELLAFGELPEIEGIFPLFLNDLSL